MKVLICGASGQLGGELREVLRSGTTDIGPIPECFFDAQVVSAGSKELDIADRAAVDKYVSSGGYDLIINCAAFTNVDACEENEEAAFAVNATGAANLASAAQSVNAKFIHLSTDYVFSGDDQKEYTETDQTAPQSAYGRTKLAGEQFVLENCKKAFVVRTAWLFGLYGPNFVKTILRIAREEGKIKVVSDQFGNPTYANDLAYEILQIAATDDYGIYHCTNKGVCSWFDFASQIVEEAGIVCEKTPCSSEEFPRPAKRPAYSPLYNMKLEATIGNEMRTWQDALVSFMRKLENQKG